MSNRTILLIDYDPQSIEDAIKPLTGAGFTVEVANDGVTGLQAFERLHPDLVLIEPMVPKKHGFEVCQEIKGSLHGRSTPVLITTGFYRGRKHQIEAKQFYGCDEYLEKPISEELLVATCQRYLVDDPDEPRLLEDLESATPATSGLPEEGLPALEELSEEEIVARLDDLIKEEPDLAGEQPASAGPELPQEALDSGAVVFETEPSKFAETAAPAARHAKQQPRSAAEVSAEPEPASVLLGVSATVAYGTPGAGADPRKPRPVPKKHVAVPDETPPASKRLWIIVAAAGLLAIAAGGIVLRPRLLGGDDAARAASATPRPAATAPAPVRESVAEEVSEPPGAPPAAPDAVAAETTSDSGPVSSPESPARPAAIPDRPTERRTEPGSRPEPEQAAPQRREDAARVTATQPDLPPPEPPAAPRAQENAETVSTEPAESLAEPSALETGAWSPPAVIADPVAEPPVETAPPSQQSPEQADPPAPDPSDSAPSPAPATETEPAETAVAAPDAEPKIERPKVARGTLLDISEVDTAPVPLDKQPPEYPPLAHRLRLEGTITMRLLVDENGKVQAVETTSTDANNMLMKAAERAARNWVYRPATKDDVPVRVWIFERLVFQL